MDVPPVPVILQAFPEHGHDLIAGHHVVGQVRDVSHLRAGRSPWVIGCGFSHLTIETQVSDKDNNNKIITYLEKPQLLSLNLKYSSCCCDFGDCVS